MNTDIRKLLVLIMLVTCSVYGASRLTTWSANQVLTAAALNSEFDNLALTGTVDRTAGRWGSNDDVVVTFGTPADVSFEWDTGQTNDALLTGLSGSFTWIILDDADKATDFAIAAQTNPTLIIHSADATVAADYLFLQHNQTDSIIRTGNGALLLQNSTTTKITINSTDVTLADDLLFTDATYDIGASGATRPRDFYLSRDATVGDQLAVGDSITASEQASFKAAATGTITLVLDTAASNTAAIQEWRTNGTTAGEFASTTTQANLTVSTRDLTNNIAGPFLQVGRNSNAGTEGGAAAVLILTEADGSQSDKIWADITGVLRINSAAPTGNTGTPTVSDTAGTVIGTQTSWYTYKNIIGRTDPQKALKSILNTKVYDFKYKESSYLMPDGKAGQTFSGPIGEKRTDWFLMNVGPQQNPALNEITTEGYEILAIQELHKRMVAVENKLKWAK